VGRFVCRSIAISLPALPPSRPLAIAQSFNLAERRLAQLRQHEARLWAVNEQRGWNIERRAPFVLPEPAVLQRSTTAMRVRVG